MLGVSLLRPFVLRRFSTSPSAWNLAQRPTERENQTTPSPSPQPDSTTGNTSGHANDGSSDTNHQPLPPPLSQYDVTLINQRLQERLREWRTHAASNFQTRADDFTAATKTTFSELGSQLNRVTGYEAIEALKREVTEQEARINAARQAAREAKTAYDEAVVQRSLSQREVNDLLQRKSNWSDSDVGRFTTLVRKDHLFEQEEVRAKVSVDETENAVEREFSQLMQTILARYHEEQVWSDKIRSASTYGSFAVLGLNMLVFVMAILVVEPWKRRRLAQTFEKKIEELSLENEARMSASLKEIGEQLAVQERLIVKLADEISQTVAGVAPVKEIIREVERTPKNDHRERMSTVLKPQQHYLELAAVGAGAFIVGVVGSLWLGR